MPRIKLEIKCSGRRVNPYKFEATGRRCGRRFQTDAKYRSRVALVELARAAGWRVAPLRRGPTVDAFCPRCCGGPG